MVFYKVPIGFGMAMAMKEPAMTENRKQSILNKSHNAGRKNARNCKQHRQITPDRGNLPLFFSCCPCYNASII